MNEPLRKREIRPSRGIARRLAPLVCLLFTLACSVISGRWTPKPPPESAPTPQTYELTQLVPQGWGTPVSVAVAYEGERYTLVTRENGYWLNELGLQAEDGRAGALLACGASILARQRVSGSAADFGLADGEGLGARFGYANGETLTLRLGGAPATGEGRYARVEGQDAVWVVNSALYTSLRRDALSLLPFPEMPWLNAQTMRSVSVERPGQERVTVARVTQSNPFHTQAELVEPFRYPANSERAATLFLEVAGLEIQSIVSLGGDFPVDELLADITVEAADGSLHRHTLARAGETVALLLDDDARVYAVAPELAAYLRQVTPPYLAEQLPGLVALNQVSRLDITRGEERHTLLMEETDGGQRYTVDAVEVGEEPFRALYQQAIGLLVERYVPQDEQPREERVSLCYTLKDGTEWTLRLLAYDAQYDLIEREGVRRFLISRGKVDALVEAAAAVCAEAQ